MTKLRNISKIICAVIALIGIFLKVNILTLILICMAGTVISEIIQDLIEKHKKNN